MIKSLKIGPLISSLRDGNKQEANVLIEELLAICHETIGDDFSPRETFNEIKSTGGLQMLFSVQSRSYEWYDMDFKIAKFVCYLVLVEDNDQIISRNFQEIIASFQCLLNKAYESYHLYFEKCIKVNDETEVEKKDDDSGGLILCNCPKCNDILNILTLVAAAVANLSLLMAAQWESVIDEDTSEYEFRDKSIFKPMLTVKSNLNNNKHHQTDIPRALSQLLSIIRTICPVPRYDANQMNSLMDLSPVQSTPTSPRINGSKSIAPIPAPTSISTSTSTSTSSSIPVAPMPTELTRQISKDGPIFGRTNSNTSIDFLPDIFPKIEQTSILCSAAVSHLARVRSCRSSLVNGGVLKLLNYWLNQTSYFLRGSPNAIEYLQTNVFLGDLLSNNCSAIAELSGGDLKTRNHELHYNIGWTDAQALTEGLPYSIVDLIDSCLDPLGEKLSSFNSTMLETILTFIEAKIEVSKFKSLNDTEKEVETEITVFNFKRPCKLVQGAFVLLTKILHSLSSRQQNRLQLVSANAPIALCMILSNAVSFKSHLRNLLRNIGSDNNNFEILLRKEEEDQDSYLSNLGTNALDALSFFLADMNSKSEISQLSLQNSAIKNMLGSPYFINTLKEIVLLPRGNARLASLRVLSTLSEWDDDFIDKLVAGDITEALVIIASESANYIEYEHHSSSHSNHHNNTHTNSNHHHHNNHFSSPNSNNRSATSTPKSFSKPSFDRSNSFSSVTSNFFERTLSRSVSQASERSYDSISESYDDYNVMEEVLRDCYILANICEANIQFSIRLFEVGLAEIVVRLVRCTHMEVRRQALRCLSSICVVVNRIPRDSFDFKISAKFQASETRMTALFVEALSVFTTALKSPNYLIQKEALQGIANLAHDDQLSVGIVECSLRQVVSLIIDHDTEKDLRLVGEEVFVNLGFTGGIKDYFVAGADFFLLVDWFYMKRSLKAQKCAYILICESLQNFLHDDPAMNYIESLNRFTKFFDRFQMLGKFRSAKFENQNLLKATMKSTTQISDTFLKYISFCSGRTAVQDVLDEEEAELREMMGLNFREHINRPSLIESWSKSLGISPNDDPSNIIHNDIFHPKIIEYLDLFIPSKLVQYVYTDLVSLGTKVGPRPYRLRTLLLPSRCYMTFDRIGRVVEQLINQVKSENENDLMEKAHYNPSDLHQKIFISLCFRNSTFEGQFHISLLQILRKCSSIISLSFICDTPSPDVTLGRIVGDIPPTIRHVTFESALSSEALQILCVLLRTQNKAWNYTNDDITILNRGLMGLAIKRQNFTKEDLNYLLEMLDPSLCYKDFSSRSMSFDDPLDKTSISLLEASEASPVSESTSSNKLSSRETEFVKLAPEVPISDIYGLRYLDLSYCKLADSNCADILRAAISIHSPILGLELEGNYIGVKFMQIFMNVSTRNYCRLRHLGISNTNLSDKCFHTLLTAVTENKSISSINASHNSLSHTNTTREAFKWCLRENKQLKLLDLSYNRFTVDTAKAIYIAILENDVINILRLIGNSACSAEEYKLLQDKLKKNRNKARGAVDVDVEEDYFQMNPNDNHDRYEKDISGNFVSLPKADACLTTSLSNEVPITTAEVTTDNLNKNVLCVLFSAPLAWKDRARKLHGIEMLDYASERAMLWQLFKEVQRDIEVQFDFATTDKLRTAVTLGCRALHFSGHGHPQGLNFEDGRSGLQFVNVDTLKDLCIAGGSKLEFVFVSACHSKRAGEAFAEAGVPHVVCVKLDARLLDTAANVFTRAFYIALVIGKTVRQAFQIGKQAVAASPYIQNSSMEGDKFMLLPEENSHDTPIFCTKYVPTWPVPKLITNLGLFPGNKEADSKALGTAFPDTSHLPQPPEDFEGREADMHQVISLVMSRRLVNLIGESGVGKTAVIAACSLYIAERSIFEHGVIFLRMLNISSYDQFLSALAREIATVFERKNLPLDMNMKPREGAGSFINSGRVSLASQLSIRNISATSGESSKSETSFSPVNDFNRTSSNDISSNTSEDLKDSIHLSKKDSFDNFSSYNSGLTTVSMKKEDDLYMQEETIINSLAPMQLLLVLDHINGIPEGSKCATDIKIFITRFLDRCKQIKMLISSTESLDLRNIIGSNVIENCLTLGPLTLHSSLRLYTRLSPSLLTTQSKMDFVMALLPPRQTDVTISCRDLTPEAAQILFLFGNGHPAKIVKLACESDEEAVNALLRYGKMHLPDGNSGSNRGPIESNA